MAEPTGKFSSQISAAWLAQIIRPFLRGPSEKWLDEGSAECAKTILFYLDEEPEPDWADVREAARKAGWTRTGNRIMSAWTVKTPDGEDDDRYGWATVFPHHRKVQLTGPGEGDRFQRSFTDLVDPTPAQVLAAARLVGIGGDRG